MEWKITRESLMARLLDLNNQIDEACKKLKDDETGSEEYTNNVLQSIYIERAKILNEIEGPSLMDLHLGEVSQSQDDL